MKPATLLMLTLIFLWASCTKEEFDIKNNNNNTILVLGHSGMGAGSTYPSNSFESIISCLYSGADGSETDIQMTADGVMVLFHGSDLSSESDAEGTINSQSWSNIEGAVYKNVPYLNYSVITLDQLWTYTPDVKNYIFTLDCKLYTDQTDSLVFFQKYADTLDSLITRFGMQNNVLIESESPAFLAMMQKKSTKYKLYIYPQSFEEGMATAKQMGLYGITISTTDINAEQIQEAHQAGFFITLWNVHTRGDNEDAVRKNPDCIQTDKISYLLDLL